MKAYCLATLLLAVASTGQVHCDVDYGFTLAGHVVRVHGNRLTVDQKSATASKEWAKINVPGVNVTLSSDGRFLVAEVGTRNVSVAQFPIDTPPLTTGTAFLHSGMWAHVWRGRGAGGVDQVSQDFPQEAPTADFVSVIRTLADHGRVLAPWIAAVPSRANYRFKAGRYGVHVVLSHKLWELFVDKEQKVGRPGQDLKIDMPDKSLFYLAKGSADLTVESASGDPFELRLELLPAVTPMFKAGTTVALRLPGRA